MYNSEYMLVFRVEGGEDGRMLRAELRIHGGAAAVEKDGSEKHVRWVNRRGEAGRGSRPTRLPNDQRSQDDTLRGSI